MTRRFSICCILGLLLPLLAAADDTVPERLLVTEQRPDSIGDLYEDNFRVGLVLSGGGAKGIAHAGVIKALEENDIPIDCVTGTSMGAIVGSLYSCGWSPEKMIKFFTAPDFSYWSTGKINPAHVNYYTRPAPTPEWLSVNISFRDTIQSLTTQILPSNLISPLPMNIEFLELYAPYTRQCDGDFNRLFVPLRTVCSDVYHKHKVVCGSGSLGDAVRASMSFPMVFKPIEMDGVLMYDGGIYDNFPVNVMEQDFDPDFIIGVSVSGPDAKPKAGNAYSQLEDMIIQNNDYSVPADKGIKIQVPVLQYGVLDFDQALTIYDIGYRTGLEMVDSIRSRCKARRSLHEVTERRQAFAKATPQLTFDSLSIRGVKPGQRRFLDNLFYEGEHHRPIPMSHVENAYYNAVTSGKFRDLLPQYELGPEGTNILSLDATLRNPWSIGVGGWITSSTQSMLYLHFGFHTLSFNSLDVDLSGWIGQSYYAAMLSGKFSLTGRHPSYLKLEAVFSRQKYFGSELLFYEDKTPTFITDNQAYLRLHYCMPAGRKGLFDASVAIGLLGDRYYPANVLDFSTTGKDKTFYKAANLRLNYEYNTLDNAMYPMSGRYFSATLKSAVERSKYEAWPDGKDARWASDKWRASLSLDWRHFISLHRHFHLGAGVQVLGTLGGLYQNYTATLVHSAAFEPTPSTCNYFNTGFRSDNYVAAGLVPVWNPVGQLQLRGAFWAYAPIRELKETPSGNCRYEGWFRRMEFIGEVAAVYNFPFASLSVYGNYLTYPTRNWNFGISFGLFFQAPRF